MAINKSQPMRFTPRGLVDAYDATEKFPGACRFLTNLIFDQVNPEFVVNKPGALQLADFAAAGFPNPGFVSIQAAIGNRIYGMIATSTFAGHDVPFCYDSDAGAFIAIGGTLAANTPLSPATAGEWTPPTLAMVGTMIIITHPGFSGAPGVFYGIIDVTNPAVPTWRSENTTTNPLLAVPTAVANFFNRAYFAVGNQVQYTDILTNPLTITNATQAIVVGDSEPINALVGLPLQTVSEGVVQALTIFKKTQIWQLTGDEALANLSINYLSLNIGTIAPRTCVQAPLGVYFVHSGGPYIVDLLGTVRPVTNRLGEPNPDLQVPFQNAITPTRWCAAYSSLVYRVCGPTVINGVQSVNDYWFDEHKRRWNGPHTLAYDCATGLGVNFVLTSVNNPGILILASPIPNSGFPTTDLGQPMNFMLQSSTFPKIGDMYTKQVAESQIELSAVDGQITYNIAAQDEVGNDVGNTTITAGIIPPLWGVAVFGLFSWTSGQQPFIPATYPVPWTAPLVFEKMQLNISGTVNANIGIGTFFARYQTTGYMTLGPQ